MVVVLKKKSCSQIQMLDAGCSILDLLANSPARQLASSLLGEISEIFLLIEFQVLENGCFYIDREIPALLGSFRDPSKSHFPAM
jgi:hypothetical protein